MRPTMIRSTASALIFLGVPGCGQPFWNPPPAPPPEVTPAPESAEAITSIYLTRTACLGTCPHYHLLFKADGTAYYVGVTNAPRAGTYVSSLSPVVFQALAQALVRNGFFSHATDLPSALDAPATIVRVNVADPQARAKTVGGFFPDYHYLWPLARSLDSLADGLPWRLVTPDTVPPPDYLGAG